MYDLTGSAWDLGLVGLYQFVPALLFTLVAGHVVDRCHRGRIVAACMVVQALVRGAAAGLRRSAGCGWAASLLLRLSVVLGARRAPSRCRRSRRCADAGAAGAAAARAGLQLGGHAGGHHRRPGAGRLAVRRPARARSTRVCALLFAVVDACCVAWRCATSTRRRAPRSRVTLRHAARRLRFVWQRKVVLGAISLDLFAVLLGGATALLPIFAKDILHVGPWGLGLLRAAPAVGALVMSLVLTRWPMRRRVGRVLLGAVAVFGAGDAGVRPVDHRSGCRWSRWPCRGAADMVSVVIRQTLVQLDTPDAMRGRVSAVNSVFIGASNQLGEFESGATAALLGPVGSVVLGGLGTIAIAAAWVRFFPALAMRDRLVLPRETSATAP